MWGEARDARFGRPNTKVVCSGQKPTATTRCPVGSLSAPDALELKPVPAAIDTCSLFRISPRRPRQRKRVARMASSHPSDGPMLLGGDIWWLASISGVMGSQSRVGTAISSCVVYPRRLWSRSRSSTDFDSTEYRRYKSYPPAPTCGYRPRDTALSC